MGKQPRVHLLWAIGTGAIITCLSGCTTLHHEPKSHVKTQIDWPAFLARHDIVWEAMPTHFDTGAFLGNGLLGATIYQQGDNGLRFEMGRSDVTEHRRDNARLPIGGLVLTTVGKIQGGTMRLDLWNAEVRGTVTTDKGSISFRSLIHTDAMAILIDLEPSFGEKGSALAWNPSTCQVYRNFVRFNDPPHPSERIETNDTIRVCIQERFSGGDFATAWTETQTTKGRRVILSIADSFPTKSAGEQAVKTVKAVATANPAVLLASHRAWWHEFYPKNFVSVPDPKLESFYWIQWYKLASASRPDRVPVDLLGPWYRNTSWPRIWWNLNIQTLYLPVYTGNRLELGESLINFIDTKRDNFYRNAKDIWKFDDCATVPHTTCYEGLRGDGSCAPDKYINPGDFTWALHNYYLHYRYSMDHAMITDQKKHAFYPLLKGSVNLYLKILKKGDDGKLHLPVLHSPEYGDAADNNYNLSLLRWGCQTLLHLNKRYQLNDPMAETWGQTLKDLTPYPIDENGLSVGANTPFVRPHRHWSHMLLVHPLHLMDFDDPANRELITKSIRHWLKTGDTKKGDGIFGWSRAAAASLCASLGDGENAIKMIHGHMADTRFVRPNTMYIEGSPVIECSIVLNRSLQDMLLQSWGDQITIFPAVPTNWKESVFHDLLAEGAFLISAERKDGKTRWIRIKSLAGEPCRVRPGFEGSFTSSYPAIPIKEIKPGLYELGLTKGQEILLFQDRENSQPVIKPVPHPEGSGNSWGIKNNCISMENVHDRK
jgi:alpha-L-fucosidase 2